MLRQIRRPDRLSHTERGSIKNGPTFDSKTNIEE